MAALAAHELDFPRRGRRNWRPELQTTLWDYEPNLGLSSSRAPALLLVEPAPGHLRLRRDPKPVRIWRHYQTRLLPHPPVGPLSWLEQTIRRGAAQRPREPCRLQFQHGRLCPAPGPAALRKAAPGRHRAACRRRYELTLVPARVE